MVLKTDHNCCWANLKRGRGLVGLVLIKLSEVWAFVQTISTPAFLIWVCISSEGRLLFFSLSFPFLFHFSCEGSCPGCVWVRHMVEYFGISASECGLGKAARKRVQIVCSK